MEMETSTEPLGPLTPGGAALAAQPEGGCGGSEPPAGPSVSHQISALSDSSSLGTGAQRNKENEAAGEVVGVPQPLGTKLSVLEKETETHLGVALLNWGLVPYPPPKMGTAQGIEQAVSLLCTDWDLGPVAL